MERHCDLSFSAHSGRAGIDLDPRLAVSRHCRRLCGVSNQNSRFEVERGRSVAGEIWPAIGCSPIVTESELITQLDESRIGPHAGIERAKYQTNQECAAR